MSILIDKVVNSTYRCKTKSYDGKWYISKPLNKLPLKDRIKDAIRVLTNKSFACHYYEDDIMYEYDEYKKGKR